MQNQGQQQNFQTSSQMSPQMNYGANGILHSHDAIGGISESLEQALFYEPQIQDPELKAILERHKTFKTQLYNTLVDTLKTGQDPATPTQTYKMNESNIATYGMQPGQPKAPATSVSELNDESISGFLIGSLKTCASSFTVAALEESNPVLRRVFADSVPNIIEMAYEMFLYQNKHHYYQVPQLNQQDMQNYINTYAPIQSTPLN